MAVLGLCFNEVGNLDYWLSNVNNQKRFNEVIEEAFDAAKLGSPQIHRVREIIRVLALHGRYRP